jgi:ATP-dependent protease HslVU (ClpYQ) peptidase subunit
MFINHYDVTTHDSDGAETISELRLTIGSQLKLKKKYKEDAISILMGSGADDETLIDVLTEALNWSGNHNTIKTGVDLLDAMAADGLLGIFARQRLVTEIALASGIFGESEYSATLKKIDAAEDKMINGSSAPDPVTDTGAENTKN